MKFGKALLNNQLPEWSKNYLSYKALKKSINEATHDLPPSSETTTAIFFQLDREVEKVNTFYTYKQAQIDRRLWILSEKYQQHKDVNTINNNNNSIADDASTSGSSCTDITDELASALQETRTQLNKLMRFAELNTKGFRKILKKLDKKLGLDTQTVYWETKVSVLPFANHGLMRSEMDKLAQWISSLSTVNGDDKNKVTPNLESAHQHPTAKLSLPSKISRHNLLTDTQNQEFANAIDHDDTEKLDNLLSSSDTMGNISTHDMNMTRYGLLELATQKGSIQCLKFLINADLDPLHYHDINERNILHKLAIHADTLNEAAITGITVLLELAPGLTAQTDFSGRRPLHYAVEHKSSTMAKLLLEHSMNHDEYTLGIGFAHSQWQDREGHTPLFLAILHGHPETVKTIIEVGNINNVDDIIAVASAKQKHDGTTTITEPDFTLSSHHPSSVAMAVELKNIALLELLIEKGASADITDEDGETALLLAIRNGFSDGVKALIEAGHANVNHSEKINGVTPLMVAAIEGNTEIVQLLLDGGADKTKVDCNGWAAYEHAIFRGYLDIGRKTKPNSEQILLESGKTLTDGSSNNVKRSENPKEGERSPSTGKSKSLARPERLYGHKYLTNQSMILITLGSNDIRNQLSRCFLTLTETLAEDQRLSIAVSATNATGEFPILDLPPNNQHHLLHPEPIVLFSSKPEDVVIRFDLIETFGSGDGKKNGVLARGTSLLATDHIYSKTKGFKGQATGNSSLRGQQTVPLVRTSTLDCVGSLGFEYFVISPFTHERMSVGDRYTYYKSLDTKLIGHRGSGMNKKGSRLQVGENTVLSFITAASLGAEYVEFDVQLTKDLVPVIYHDWTVTETGFDIPLNAITVEQFLNLRPSGHIKEYHTGVSNDGQGEIIPTVNTVPETVMDDIVSSATPAKQRVNRSHSLGSIKGVPTFSRRSDHSDRLALTRTNKLGKVKGNGPETIQAPFTTLAETLKRVPSTAGCNIEVKYPMVDEAEDDELHQFQELNIYVDTILECVYNNADENRRIIFSSFHPEICLALNLKQPNYPVFFLTDAGTLPMADIRCNSLQGALRFAKQADLLGIVAASEPVLEAPRMVSVVKETGLLLFTYGVLNNEVQNSVAQKKYGVDAVIVDSVLAVRKGLRGD
ncbi:Glycerophosphoryl diester phosphodiesterase family-domain-containing protein [Halteromyces radiatus]|uniref:Glycerophosphoryl diester phosphodiesterase family-domain-containing protein n=1 Tax=Halteromyces radiatus TaxID=101107 RepID=UPI002220B80B|nr:Glycerophosphoryl diester phosphodiesterase family-domain-containing protein [Halteromyces radiatus]KAI8093447.1 Glycerophosphoryl diester phosphodiesterase family-domain-containing protein [Halteromyces radiatus]